MPVSVCVGLFGHSAVLHNVFDAVFIYGGYQVNVDGASLSSRLYSLRLQLNDRDAVYHVSWNRIGSPRHSQVQYL